MLVESKSNLARLMATENLIVEQRQVSTAYFDIKNRVLTVPVLNGNLSNELIDLLLGHEVGHALETPAQGWHDSVVDLKVNRSILNVCEDVRIEKKIKRKFPGIRISFIKGYRELMEMNFFGTKGDDLNKRNFIDRVNLYTKGGAAQGIDFTSDEYSLVREVEAAETFEETVAIAMKIQKFMKENPDINKQEPEMGNMKLIDEEDDGESEIGPSEVSSGSDSGEEQPSGESGKEPAEDTKQRKGSGTSGAKKKNTDESDDVEIESETDNHFREKEKELYSSNRKDMKYSNIPELILKNIVVSHKTLISEIEGVNNRDDFRRDFRPDKMLVNYNKFRIESNKVVSYLVKEFEMRKNAEQQARAKISKTGELNLSKIHEYKYNDDIFARLTKVPNGKSHGLVMFIDWSGSMADYISPTVKQLLNLVMFCKKVNIPFDVYAFSSSRLPERASSDVQRASIAGDLHVSPDFSLLNILSHKMTAKEFTKMASYLLDYGTGRRHTCSNMQPPDIMELGGTPLNEAVISAFQVIPKFKSDNKLQIVNTVFLTDGEGSRFLWRIEGDAARLTPIEPTKWLRSFFRDPVTKASVELPGATSGSRNHSRNLSTEQTIALLTLLKQRTDANVIGFYITNMRNFRNSISLYFPADKAEKMSQEREAEFRKKNFTFVDSVGYDEYYFLRSDKLDTDDEDEFEVTSTTTRGLVSAFSKYTGSRVSNRVVLNRFINLIA
jgi:hypothetical protein